MSNILTTQCENCSFYHKDRCDFGKDINNRSINGFCRHKRSISEKKLAPTLDIIKEECKITCVILAIQLDKEKLKATIDNVYSKPHIIEEIIIVLRDSGISDIIEIAKRLSGDQSIKWKIEHNQEDNVDDWYLVDLISKKIDKTNWFITLNQGDVLTSEQCKVIENCLDDLDNNVICFYFDENDPLRVLCSKFAYYELIGHTEIPWFNKIKSFDNWREHCIKI